MRLIGDKTQPSNPLGEMGAWNLIWLHPSCPTASSPISYGNINMDLEEILLQLQCHKRAAFTSYRSRPASPEAYLKLHTTEQNQSTSHRNQTHSLKTMGLKEMSGNPSFLPWFGLDWPQTVNNRCCPPACHISRILCLDVPDRDSFWWFKTQQKVFLGQIKTGVLGVGKKHIPYLRTVGAF